MRSMRPASIVLLAFLVAFPTHVQSTSGRAVMDAVNVLSRQLAKDLDRRQKSLGRTAPARADDAGSLILKANMAYEKGDYSAALEHLNSAYASDPQNPRINNMMGSLYYLFEDYEMARKYWSDSLTLNRRQPEIETYLKQLPENPARWGMTYYFDALANFSY